MSKILTSKENIELILTKLKEQWKESACVCQQPCSEITEIKTRIDVLEQIIVEIFQTQFNVVDLKGPDELYSDAENIDLSIVLQEKCRRCTCPLCVD